MRDEIDAMLSKLNEAAGALSDSMRHCREVDAIRRAVEYIKRHEAATLNPEPTTAEPTIEECIAAMNRNQHGRHGNWFVRCSDKNRTCSFDEIEIRALGAYYIAREKAAEAKGGV